MNATGWILSCGAAAVLATILWYARKKEQPCSDDWIRDQIRRRGLSGFSGSYHED